MMKRINIILFMLVSVVYAYAQNYNSSQETLRSEINSYLTRQGLNPEYQSDGLKFKSEGANFYIEIDKDANNPMYLRLCRYIKYSDQITREEAVKNLNDYNVKFAVKVSCLEKSILVSSEIFLTKSTEFTYIFDDMLRQVKSACKLITE